MFPNASCPDILNERICLQQDGPPPHFDSKVINYLKIIFLNSWVGRVSLLEWPSRSADINPYDSFPSSYLYETVILVTTRHYDIIVIHLSTNDVNECSNEPNDTFGFHLAVISREVSNDSGPQK